MGHPHRFSLHDIVLSDYQGVVQARRSFPATYLVGGILFILLSIQCTLIAGAVKIINTTDYYEEQLERIVNQSTPTAAADSGKDILGNLMSMFLGSNPLGSGEDREVSKAESEKITEQLVEEYPILSNYFDYGEFTGYTVKELPHAMAETIVRYMKTFILYRLLWCLGFVVVGAILVIKTMQIGYSMERRRRTGGEAPIPTTLAGEAACRWQEEKIKATFQET